MKRVYMQMSWKICFRGKKGPATFGLELVQAAAQEYLTYAPTVSDSISLSFEDDLILLVCRNGNNCQNKELDAIAGQKIPAGEGYLVAFKEHPYCEGRKMILITSETEVGLMYGCADFAEKYLPRAAQAHQHNPDHYYFKNPFEESRSRRSESADCGHGDMSSMITRHILTTWRDAS